MDFITSIQFPFQFSKERLQTDMKTAFSVEWQTHFNKADYDGDWSVLALLSRDGKEQTVTAMPEGDQPLSATPTLQKCPYFQEILETLLFEKTSVRLMRLAVGAVIKPHCDHCLGYEDGVFRLHIPIVTNPDVEFIVAGKRVVMDEGTCWYINANEEHSVANRGSVDRIHLVIDGKRNDWTDALFFAQAPVEAYTRPPKAMSQLEKEQILAELERLGTPVALELIRQLKNPEK